MFGVRFDKSLHELELFLERFVLSLEFGVDELAFFVLPNDSSISSSSAIAFQKDGVTEIKVPLSFSIIQLLMWVLDCGKVLAKYLLIMGYIWVLYGKIRAYVKGRKLKSV